MITDLIVILVIAFLLWRGSSRGILQSLIGPFAFITATAGAYLYYQSTHNILISLAIGILGPMVLYWTLLILLRSIAKLLGGETQPNILSRIAGAAVTTAWGLIIFIPIIIMLSLFPNFHPKIKEMTTDIKNSRTYASIRPYLKWLNLPEDKAQVVAAPSVHKSKPIHTNALAEIQEDKHMQELLNDPVLKEALEQKNYAALLSNPKIMQMAQDPEFVKKLMAAYGQLQEQGITLPAGGLKTTPAGAGTDSENQL